MKKQTYIRPCTEVLDMEVGKNILLTTSIPVKEEPTDATEPEETRSEMIGTSNIWDNEW